MTRTERGASPWTEGFRSSSCRKAAQKLEQRRADLGWPLLLKPVAGMLHQPAAAQVCALLAHQSFRWPRRKRCRARSKHSSADRPKTSGTPALGYKYLNTGTLHGVVFDILSRDLRCTAHSASKTRVNALEEALHRVLAHPSGHPPSH